MVELRAKPHARPTTKARRDRLASRASSAGDCPAPASSVEDAAARTLMTKSPSIFRRAYRLTPNRGADDAHVSQLRIGGEKTSQIVLLPYSKGLGYFIVPTRGAVRSIEGDDFRAERLSLPLSLWVRLRLGLLFKKKKFLRFEEFSLFSFGVKPERKRFTTFNQHMFNTGVALDGRLVTTHPELLQGWTPVERAKPQAPPAVGAARAAAIVVHVYYEDTWPDIAGVLSRLGVPFDLIVTTVPGRERLVETVKRDFPDADVIVSENRGRDVRPFLELLETGRLDRYRYVCKISRQEIERRRAHVVSGRPLATAIAVRPPGRPRHRRDDHAHVRG